MNSCLHGMVSYHTLSVLVQDIRNIEFSGEPAGTWMMCKFRQLLFCGRWLSPVKGADQLQKVQNVIDPDT